MKFETTKGYGINSLKIAVYGRSGVGKTTLASTTGCPEKTLVLSAESGLLPLRGLNIAYKTIERLEDLFEVGKFLKESKHSFEWVILDSISEIAEVCLSMKKETVKSKAGKADTLRAYGETNELMMRVMKAFRDLPMNVVFIAQQDRNIDEEGRMYYGASMPGKRLSQSIPYLMDEVFALRVTKDEEGKVTRFFQTGPDASYDAKDRSGSLDQYEPANLKQVLSKISGG